MNLGLRVWAVMAASLGLAACMAQYPTVSRPPPPIESPTAAGARTGAAKKPAPDSPKRFHATIPIFYATDRRDTQAEEPARRYGTERADLSYGILRVTIPAGHKPGNLERPDWWKMEFHQDAARHITLESIDSMAEDDFYSRLRARIENSKGQEAFVFVHGYNLTFEQAAWRTGQIAYDLNFQGAPILYSWPSQADVGKYAADVENSDWTAQHLEAFLSKVAEQSSASTVHLIAHSMGNRPLINALKQIAQRLESGNPPYFDEVVLTAPDIDAALFRDLAVDISPVAERFTLYASRNDKALNISKTYNGRPRAGDISDVVLIVPGVDTIDASAVETDMIGHSYYQGSRTVLSDMFHLMKTRLPPENRFGLQSALWQGHQYWVIQ